MYTGIIRDFDAVLEDENVVYRLQLGDQFIPLNSLVGGRVRLEFAGEKRCINCNRKATKLFNNGYCWPCFQKLARNDLCQVRPTLCHYDTCREPEWGDAFCMIPTYVYLAKSSDIKVGITRNVPGRWLDQGAVEAVPIALVPTRKMAGELELFLATQIPDRTNWRKMLKGEVSDTAISEVRARLLELIPPDFRGYILPDETVRSFAYPVSEPPNKIASHDLDKGPAEGRLLGIKGSYLMFDTGVLNVPKYTGYCIFLDAERLGLQSAVG